MQQIEKFFRVNYQIKAKEVRVIDHEGRVLGVMEPAAAIKVAEGYGFDLVEVSPNTQPPVCKIANFGKMKYELQKKATDSKKKQKVIDTKEIKFSVNIGKNDYDVKIKQILKFIAAGDKAKVSIKLKGREITHVDLADKMMTNIFADVEEHAKFESVPKMEGKQIVSVLVKK